MAVCWVPGTLERQAGRGADAQARWLAPGPLPWSLKDESHCQALGMCRLGLIPVPEPVSRSWSFPVSCQFGTGNSQPLQPSTPS